MDKKHSKLIMGNVTDIGLNPNRPTNQDYYGTYEGSFGSLFIVCDGMGGHAGGDKASRLAVETISKSIRDIADDPLVPVERNLAESVEAAHNAIMDYADNHPDMKGMGTTLIMLLIKENQYWWVNVGDSRLYIMRGKEVTQISKDHSVVQGMVDAGIITAEQALDHPDRNCISRALGAQSHKPDISGPHQLFQNDVFLLCTDGLHQYLRKGNELPRYLEQPPLSACQQLVDLAKKRGGSDNITLQIVKVIEGNKLSVSSQSLISRNKFIIAACLFILVFIGAIFMIKRNAEKPDAGKSTITVSPVIDRTMGSNWFRELTSRLKPSIPSREEQKYVDFINEIVMANDLAPIELSVYAVPSVNGQVPLIYISNDAKIILLKPNQIGNLNKTKTDKFQQDDIFSLLLLATELIKDTKQVDFQQNPYTVEDLIPIPESIVNGAKGLITNYKSEIYSSANLQRSIRDFRLCLKLNHLSLIWTNPKQAVVTGNRVQSNIKQTPIRQQGNQIMPQKEDSTKFTPPKSIETPSQKINESDQAGDNNE